jgi:hypothetical protein
MARAAYIAVAAQKMRGMGRPSIGCATSRIVRDYGGGFRNGRVKNNGAPGEPGAP